MVQATAVATVMLAFCSIVHRAPYRVTAAGNDAPDAACGAHAPAGMKLETLLADALTGRLLRAR
jgi:hypothetical protein